MLKKKYSMEKICAHAMLKKKYSMEKICDYAKEKV